MAYTFPQEQESVPLQLHISMTRSRRLIPLMASVIIKRGMTPGTALETSTLLQTESISISVMEDTLVLADLWRRMR
jgi:hypothetical protein